MTSFFINFLSLQLLVLNEQSKFNYRKKKIDVQDYGPPIFHDNLKNHLKVSILKMKFKINEEKQREGQLNQDRFVKMSLTRLVAMVCKRILVAGTEKYCRFDKYIIGGLNGNLKLTELEVKKEA